MIDQLLPYAIRAAALLLGLIIGAKLPDIDLAPVLPLRHRSVWTHGPLLPLLLYWLSVNQAAWVWWLVVGILPMLALHHLADMFPKSWHGSSSIKCFPFAWSFNPALSFVWIAFGALSSGYAFWLLAGGHILAAVQTVSSFIQ